MKTTKNYNHRNQFWPYLTLGSWASLIIAVASPTFQDDITLFMKQPLTVPQGLIIFPMKQCAYLSYARSNASRRISVHSGD